MWPPENVRVIRSDRRRRTVQARVARGAVEVRIPASFSAAEEREAVGEVLGKLEGKMTASGATDAQLRERAERLNREVLGGAARFTSIRWSSRQTTRWGSCTPATGEIRISDRLKEVPDYVVDAVVVHELAHTIVSGHTARFWQLADQAPQAERAKGYLEAFGRFGT